MSSVTLRPAISTASRPQIWIRVVGWRVKVGARRMSERVNQSRVRYATQAGARGMAKQIICQCGYVGRGDSAEDAAHVIEKHMQSDHPDLVGEVTFEDLLAMAEEA